MSALTRLSLTALIFAIAIGVACSDVVGERDADQRVIIVQGVCSLSAQFAENSSWTQTVKRELEAQYGFTDLPTGDPDDQIIEFSYSTERPWNAEYQPTDTLRPLAESSSRLGDIYATYPDSDFFILAHSLGGVVVLDALANSVASDGDLHERTLGAATISSPVKGLSKEAADLAAFTIELLACRDISGVTNSGEVWNDLLAEGDAIQRIRSANWDSLRVINFANKRDRVTDWQVAHSSPPFDSHCFDLREGLISLNHDVALRDTNSLGLILRTLINGESVETTCSD